MTSDMLEFHAYGTGGHSVKRAELQALVNRAMENAHENGFEFEAWTFLECAEDLVTHDADLCDKATAQELAPLVKKWFLASKCEYRMYD